DLDVDVAMEMMKRTGQWRHQLKLPQLRDEDFPAELFKNGCLFAHESDLDGNRVLYIRASQHKKSKELAQLRQLFAAYTFNKLDMETGGRGICAVFDCTNAGIRNVDLDFMRFFVDSYIQHCPFGVKHILVLDMPWILT